MAAPVTEPPKHAWSLNPNQPQMSIGTGEEQIMGSGPIMMVDEAERYVEELRTFDISEIGSREWFAQHERLEKLNLQAHQNAQQNSDEFVMEAILTFDKMSVLIHELLAIEAWKEHVLPELTEGLCRGNNSMRGYFILYHEATLVNLLEVVLYHGHACEAAGEIMMELADYCARKLALLNYRGAFEGATPAGSNDSMRGMSAKEVAEETAKMTPESELAKQKEDIEFHICVVTVALVRFMSEHITRMPLSVMTRMFDTHDVIVALVPLLENPPWTRKLPGDDGAWQKLVDLKWQNVDPVDLLKITKMEGQVWLALYHLMCNGECRSRYHFNSFRKAQILRLRKYLNDVMLDQLPVLADVQRYMDELTIMTVPEAAGQGQNPLLMVEQVPQLRQSLVTGKDWPAIAARQLETIFAQTDDRRDEDLRRLADMYTGDDFNDLMGAARCAKCGAVATKRCSRCKNEWYCGRKCQVESWAAHKPLCDVVCMNAENEGGQGGNAKVGSET